MSSAAPDRAATGAAAAETDESAGVPEPGRRIVLVPSPPGSWRVLLGGGAAVLAPLFGFLVGSILGAGAPGDAVDPMFLALFTGIVIGGIGVLVAFAGGARLWRHFHESDIAES